MFKEKAFHVLLFCSIILAATAVLQYLYPDLSFLHGGLIITVVLTIFLKRNVYTSVFGGIALLLIIISAFYPHETMERQQVVMQHVFSAVLVLLATVAVLYVKRLYLSVETDQQRVAALFEHATEGIILTNSKGEIVLINPAALQLFRYTENELIGKKIEILIPGRFHEAHLKYREGFFTHPSSRSMGHGRDLFAKTKTGDEFPVEVSLSFYKQKTEFFVIAFVVDITERKEFERSIIHQRDQLEKVSDDVRKLNAELENKVDERTTILKEALQELEKSRKSLSEALEKEKELSEIKSRFVSMASHEFRTPLSTVLSSAALVSKYLQADDQDKRERHINRIKDSVKHMNDLLEDFLSLGKLEEGRVSVSAEDIYIRNFLDETAEEIRTLAKPGQEIAILYSGDDSFSTDPRLLKNILLNLLGNAIKFSPPQSTVQLNAVVSASMLVVAVKDEGIGIAEEDQPYLFSSFYRGRNAVNIPGTGLGLHIVKRYVEMLGGTLQLESSIGKGTSVTVSFPALLEKES